MSTPETRLPPSGVEMNLSKVWHFTLIGAALLVLAVLVPVEMQPGRIVSARTETILSGEAGFIDMQA
jgi:hypothetical protein